VKEKAPAILPNKPGFHPYYVGTTGVWVHNTACPTDLLNNAEIKERVKEPCFVAGTLVHTKEGLRPIEKIKVGDYVLSKPEDGQGELEYKRVVKTMEFEDKETWFVSWYDSDSKLAVRMRAGEITPEELLEAMGNSFVVTTPNHPFWVVSSDEEFIRCDETANSHWPYPQKKWARADHLSQGMTLLLADGRVVKVESSRRVYKTNEASWGWVDCFYYSPVGMSIGFDGQKVQPLNHIHSFYKGKSLDDYGVRNERYTYDSESCPDPDSWYRSKVYNLEVEDFHTYFVDTLGVWVKCGDSQVFPDIPELDKYLLTLNPEELKGVRVGKDSMIRAKTGRMYSAIPMARFSIRRRDN
jgi:hypothetical protein